VFHPEALARKEIELRARHRQMMPIFAGRATLAERVVAQTLYASDAFFDRSAANYDLGGNHTFLAGLPSVMLG
jgi:hypothetical protein